MSVYLFTVTKKTVIKITVTPNTDGREFYDSDLDFARAEVEDIIAGGGDFFVDYVEMLEEGENTRIETLED